MSPNEGSLFRQDPDSGLNPQFSMWHHPWSFAWQVRWTMTRYIAGVLSVIAVGTMLIAYGLLNPRIATTTGDGLSTLGRPLTAADRVTLLDNGWREPQAYATAQRASLSQPEIIERERPVRRVRTVSAQPTRVIERAPRRDWTKTAMVIGGSTAAGAGLGAIFGGKKGALIGAALGGGTGTIYEVRKR